MLRQIHGFTNWFFGILTYRSFWLEKEHNAKHNGNKGAKNRKHFRCCHCSEHIRKQHPHSEQKLEITAHSPSDLLFGNFAGVKRGGHTESSSCNSQDVHLIQVKIAHLPASPVKNLPKYIIRVPVDQITSPHPREKGMMVRRQAHFRPMPSQINLQLETVPR